MSKQASIPVLLTLFCLLASNFLGQSPIAANSSPEKALAAKLIAEKTDAVRQQLLSANRGLINVKLAEELQGEANRLFGTVPWAQVLDIYLLQLTVAEKMSDPAQIVKALNGVGNTRLRMGERKEALEAYQRAIALAEKGADRLMFAKLLSNLCQAKDCELEEWRSNLLRALSIAREVGEKGTAATTLTRLGNGHTRRGYLMEALKFHEEALSLGRETGDKQQLSISLSSIGLVYQNQGRYEEASNALRESINISREIGDKEGEIVDLYNLGNQLVELGDLSSALTLFNESIELGKANGQEQQAIGAEFNLADLFHKLGRNDLAEAKFLDLVDRFTKSGDNYGRHLALQHLGDLRAEVERYSDAIGYYEQALKISLSEKNDSDEAAARAKLGSFYARMGDHAKALESFQKTVEINSRVGSPNEVFASTLALAAYHLEFGDLQIAEKLVRDMAGQVEIARYDDRWRYYLLAGRVRMRTGRSADARQSFLSSISLINSKTSGLHVEQSREYLTSKLEPFHGYIEFLVQTKESPAAFEIAESSHSRALVNVVRNGRIDEKFLPSKDLETLGELKAKIVSLNRLLDIETSKSTSEPKTIDEIKRNIEIARRELETFQLSTTRNDGLRTARADIEPISASDMAQLLNNPNSAAVEFVVTPKITFAFVVGRAVSGTIRPEAVPIRITEKQLKDRIAGFRKSISEGDLRFTAESAGLFNALLKPLASHLAGRTNVILVPDGPLWDLPFQALMDEKGKFLAEKMAVSYAPSLTALNEMRKKAATRKLKQKANSELIAFGNPIVSSETSMRVKRIFMSEKLEPLPEAERLVNGLSKMYGAAKSKVYTGAAAREEIAKKESPNYRIVQFATHGILNNASPMYSHLVFAKDDKNPNEDGLLEAWELKDLDLNADMVILSACETARGRISAGEGIIGMTWASFIAGAPTTVASQWKVESSSTTELMLEFHRQLLTGKVSKAEALRRAQLKLMRMPKYRHPSYWAGFVIVGDAS